MGVKDNLLEARAYTEFKMLCKFKEPVKVLINDIPETKTLFPGTKNDYWYKVDFKDNEDISACVYELAPNTTFFAHVHELHKEKFLMITEGGRLKVHTEKYIRILEYGDSICFDKNEAHAVVNITKKPLKILVIWSPKMIGFDLEFKENDG